MPAEHTSPQLKTPPCFEALPSDILLKIAELSVQPMSALGKLRRLNRRVRDLVPVIRQTSFVARVLLKKVWNPRHSDMIKLVLEETAKKIQAQREAETNGALMSLALTSTTLERHMLAQVITEMAPPQYPQFPPVMSRMAMPTPPHMPYANYGQPSMTPTQPSPNPPFRFVPGVPGVPLVPVSSQTVKTRVVAAPTTDPKRRSAKQ